jgi:uncharacterized damage-inducible protein DinB
MMRGTFANIRLKNEMVPGIEGGFTHDFRSDEPVPIFDQAMRYKKEHTPQILIAGKEYGTGSSRDWAAKGVNLLGVKAVVCETFERIHRSNLVGMGVLPLQFKDGMTRKTLNLTGHESFDVGGIEGGLRPGMDIPLTIHRRDGQSETITLTCRIDTAEEIEYFKNGGVLAAHMVAMAQNNAWANHRLLLACEALTKEEFAAVRVGFFPSLRATFNHILWVDQYYIDAVAGDDALKRYSEPAPDFADAQAMREAQAASDRRLIVVCERQTEQSLAADCVLPRPNRKPPPSTTAFVLAHLFQHQMHHRGQAHAMLSSTRIKPPQLDEFFLAGEEDLRREELRTLGLPLR